MSKRIELSPEKRKALLAEIEAEKRRRLQAACDAGEAVVLQPMVITGERGKTPTESQIEAAKARELERFRHENPDDKRTIHLDVVTITTGVVRSPEFGKRTARSPTPVETTKENNGPSYYDISQRPASRPPTAKEYIRVQVEPATDGGHPGRIAEGHFIVEFDLVPEGYCNVFDMRGDHVGGKILQAGQDAATVARQVLKEKRSGYRRLVYPDLGIV